MQICLYRNTKLSRQLFSRYLPDALFGSSLRRPDNPLKVLRSSSLRAIVVDHDVLERKYTAIEWCRINFAPKDTRHKCPYRKQERFCIRRGSSDMRSRYRHTWWWSGSSVLAFQLSVLLLCKLQYFVQAPPPGSR